MATRAASLSGSSQVLRRDHDARREPLEIPLEWGRQRLVEVVDVEDDVALRRREAAEVHQVRVAAGLHADPAASGSWPGRPPSARPSRGRTRTATPTCARSGSESGPGCGPRWIRSEARPDRAEPWAPSILPAPRVARRRAALCPWRGVRPPRDMASGIEACYQQCACSCRSWPCSSFRRPARCRSGHGPKVRCNLPERFDLRAHLSVCRLIPSSVPTAYAPDNGQSMSSM